jgi:hypothetical protein
LYASAKLREIDHRPPESRTQNEPMQMAWGVDQPELCRLGKCLSRVFALLNVLQVVIWEYAATVDVKSARNAVLLAV